MDPDFLCVIDDEPDVLDGFCENMKVLGAVKGFTSAENALAAFDQGFSPIVTIVDLKMPHMNGLDFIQQCRLRGRGGSVILASGNAGKNDLARALNLGVSGFLEKPFTAVELRQAIQTVMPEPSKVNQAEMIRLYADLSEVYFETLVVLENSIIDNNLPFLPQPETKKSYLSLKSREKKLRQSLDKLRAS